MKKYDPHYGLSFVAQETIILKKIYKPLYLKGEIVKMPPQNI
jgi:hypothetical protein